MVFVKRHLFQRDVTGVWEDNSVEALEDLKQFKSNSWQLQPLCPALERQAGWILVVSQSILLGEFLSGEWGGKEVDSA